MISFLLCSRILNITRHTITSLRQARKCCLNETLGIARTGVRKCVNVVFYFYGTVASVTVGPMEAETAASETAASETATSETATSEVAVSEVVRMAASDDIADTTSDALLRQSI